MPAPELPATEKVTEAPPHAAGDVIAGRYVLERKLGEGGMGVVWAAHSVALDVSVALKMLHRSLAGTAAVERMAREARASAQLGHPAIVRVLDFGTSEHGEPFLAMELLQGEDLYAQLARGGGLSPGRAVSILLPVIEALATAHAKGIVHRDIKPENIFIATDDQGREHPKLLDFGIAKLERSSGPSRLTEVGALIGSPLYFSPEQAEGMDDVDFRTDIWAVGVVLYELLTGIPPFQAPNHNALMRRILSDEPTPITAANGGDQALWEIVSRCLAKDPGARWPSMWALGEALARWWYERGGRVDAAARSIEDVWIRGLPPGAGADGEVLDAPTLRPQSTQRGSAVRANTEIVTTADFTEDVPGRRGLRGVLALAAVVATTLIVVVVLARRSSGDADVREVGRAAAAPGEPARPSVRAEQPSTTSPLVAPVLPSVPSGEPPRAPATETARGDLTTGGVSRRVSPSPASRAARPAASSAVPSPYAKPRSGRRIDTEFGF
ncbi:MAG TPA: serine/threonine-protein kinase [Polyangiaceae bacterium]|nr:serine/threonine-protein kinase [Polyangiaceae bacterium]